MFIFVQPILPSRPLKLKRAFTRSATWWAIGTTVAGVAAMAGYAAWTLPEIRDIPRQARVWRDGTVAISTHASGKSTSHTFLTSYDLKVSYQDQQGRWHDRPMEFSTFGEIDTDATPEVRYLVADPAQIALSWAVEAETERWLHVAAVATVGIGLIGGGALLLAFTSVRRIRDARHCADRSDEVLLKVTKVVLETYNGKPSRHLFHFSGTGPDGRELTGSITFPVEEPPPLFVDVAQTTLLGLVSTFAPKRPVILRSDFHPFELTESENDTAHKAIASRQGRSGEVGARSRSKDTLGS